MSGRNIRRCRRESKLVPKRMFNGPSIINTVGVLKAEQVRRTENVSIVDSPVYWGSM